MCIAIPSKIVLIKKGKIIVEQLGKRREIRGSLIRSKIGDYVFVQNNFIIRKINKKEAKEIINLIQK